MSANTWFIISMIGYFAALVGLIITVVLYFRLDILDVIGDLSGRTVARELKSMRENRATKGSSNASKARRVNKTSGTSRSGKTGKTGGKQNDRKTTGKTGRTSSPANAHSGGFSAKRPKNGTAEMGGQIQSAQPDKRVLHSKTDRLSNDTEKLYEDFDPRVEYSRTDIPEEAPEAARSGGTAVLRSGTEVLTEHEETTAKRRGTEVLPTGGTEVLPAGGTSVLKPGTSILDASSGGGTTLLTEEAQIEPVRFSITRSYLIVHTEETIL